MDVQLRHTSTPQGLSGKKTTKSSRILSSWMHRWCALYNITTPQILEVVVFSNDILSLILTIVVFTFCMHSLKFMYFERIEVTDKRLQILVYQATSICNAVCFSVLRWCRLWTLLPANSLLTGTLFFIYLFYNFACHTMHDYGPLCSPSHPSVEGLSKIYGIQNPLRFTVTKVYKNTIDLKTDNLLFFSK